MPYCPDCGTASTQNDQRFCQSCGQSLQAPAAAPTPSMGPPTEPEYQVIGGPVETEGPSAGPRHLGRILAAAAILATMTGGAFLAYTVVFNKAGGSSPQDAVTRLLSAVADQDGVEALRMLNPGETDGFDEVYASVRERIAEAGLASDDDNKVLEAVDIDLKDLQLDVKDRGENAARVYIVDGRLQVTIDQGKLPEEFQELYDDLDSEIVEEFKDIDISEILEDAGADGEVFLTTIKRDDRWYVSPIATAGEYIVAEENLDPLTAEDFDQVAAENAPKPKTATDPEGALTVLADAVSSLKVEEIFAALPEEEVAALRPFSSVLQDQLDTLSATDLTVSDLETEFKELDDDLGRLTIKRGRLTGIVDGNKGGLEIAGTCVRSSESTFDEDCLPEEIKKQTGIDSMWVILHKEGGGWQIDPRATLISYAISAIDNFDEDFLTDAFEQGFGGYSGDSYYGGDYLYEDEGSTTF